MGNDIRDFVGAHGPLSDPAKFIGSLIIGDLSEDKSSFNVDQHSVIFLYFGDAQTV